MKQFFTALMHKADAILEHDVATRDRSVASRIATLTLFTASLSCIIYYCITRIL